MKGEVVISQRMLDGGLHKGIILYISTTKESCTMQNVCDEGLCIFIPYVHKLTSGEYWLLKWKVSSLIRSIMLELFMR